MKWKIASFMQYPTPASPCASGSERTWVVLQPSLPLGNPAAVGRKSERAVQVAANQLWDGAGSCYPVQGLWHLIKQIRYCCLSTSRIFLVKTLCLCFSLSFEDVLVLPLLPLMAQAIL